jgi:hypothetical protein
MYIMYINQMITIRKNNSNEQFVVDKKNIVPLVRKSKLAFLAETKHYIDEGVDSNDQYTFDDMMIRTNYLSKDPLDWNILVAFLSGKTMFHTAPIIEKYVDSISVLTEYVPENILMDRLGLTVFSNNTPPIIEHMGLGLIYQQLIFYEYIYKSDIVPYSKKARIMVENNYTELMELLQNYYLELNTSSDKSDQESENAYFDQMVDMYYESPDKSELLAEFIEFHKNWLDYNPTANLSIKLYQHIVKHVDQEFGEQLEIYNLCHLNKLYSSGNDLMKNHIEGQLDMLLPILKTNLIDDSNKIALYGGIDLIVRMMENDCKMLEKMTKNTKTKILARWLKMSSPTNKCFNRSTTYPHKHCSDQRIRHIVLSRTIKNLLENMCITFSEMGYILSMDRLDMFEILCKNLEFRSIHHDIYINMPPKIIKYTFDKHMMANRTNHVEPPQTIVLNPYNLIDREPYQIVEVMQMFNQFFKKNVTYEYKSIVDRYDYMDCTYIMIYWEYMTIMRNNPILGSNLMELFKNMDHDTLLNGELDMVILRCVVEHLDNRQCVESMRSYIDSMCRSENIYLTGPDFTGIRKELEQYGVGWCQFLELMILNSNNFDKDN